MTENQQNRIEELYEIGVSTYLDKTDFDVTEWLFEDNLKEYLRLRAIQEGAEAQAND